MRKFDNLHEPMGPLQTRIMLILWQNGDLNVHDVLTTLNSQPTRPKTLAYTTVLTVLRSLVKRKYLSQKPIGRAHIFRSIITEDAYRLEVIRHLHQTLFSGNTRDLITCIARSDIDPAISNRLQHLWEEPPASVHQQVSVGP